jgi:hypothetical protein
MKLIFLRSRNHDETIQKVKDSYYVATKKIPTTPATKNNRQIPNSCNKNTKNRKKHDLLTPYHGTLQDPTLTPQKTKARMPKS